MNRKIIIFAIIIIIILVAIVAFTYYLSTNKGTLVVNFNFSKAPIKLNGQTYETSSPFMKNLKSGEYDLVISKEYYSDYRQKINIERGKTLEINPNLEIEPALKDKLTKFITQYVQNHSVKGIKFKIEGLKLEGNKGNANIIFLTQEISQPAEIRLKKLEGDWFIDFFGTE